MLPPPSVLCSQQLHSGSAFLLPLSKSKVNDKIILSIFLKGQLWTWLEEKFPLEFRGSAYSSGTQLWGGKCAMLIKQLLKLMIKTWGCLSKRIPGISSVHFAWEPGWLVSKKSTFFSWRSDGEAGTISSIISLDPYKNPLETDRGKCGVEF